MNKEQRKNAAKYIYDISKGIALVVVVNNLAQGKWDILQIFVGIIVSIIFFGWAYFLDGGIENG